tara:strand:+ start:225 stop:2321 length:2097 start_codon:yes stop_codon:yes gene_type:complete
MPAYSDGYITGRPMPDFVVKEINDRGAALPSDSWKVSKKPWMTLTSFSSEPMPLADYEKRTYDDFYTKTDAGRIVPQPAINSIEIGTTGANGSMRKGTVAFTLYSIEQLKLAQRAYFIPGLTAIAQWGWNIQSNGDPITRLTDETLKTAKSMYELQNKIFEKSEENSGCTEGMCGVISDFNWSFDPSTKSYKCEITIDSPGKAYISGPINVAGSKTNSGCKQSTKDEGSGNWMKVVLKDVAESNMKIDSIWKGVCNHGFPLNLDEDAKEDATWYSALTGWFGSPKMNYYVQWDWWESAIISGLSPTSPNYKTLKDSYHSRGGVNFSDTSGHFTGGHVWLLNSSRSRMKIPSDADYYPWGSADPWVCIIPGHAHWENKQASNGSKNPRGEFGIVGTWAYDTWVDNGNAASTYTHGRMKDEKKDKVHYIELGKVLLNTYFLWTTFMRVKTIDEYVMAVARKVNDVCGGFWDLELVDDPKDPSVMRVIDRNYVPKPKPKAAVINLLGNTSARTWGVSTDIPQALRHSIMMATQRGSDKGNANTNEPQGSLLDYADGITDSLVGKQKLSGTKYKNEKCKRGSDKDGGDNPSTASLRGDCYTAFAALADNRSDETVDSALGAMKAFHGSKGKNAPQSFGGVSIPLGLDLTIDGIGGLTWGYLFETDYTPKVIDKTHAFQIKGVKHSIGQDDWTTSIETALRIY